MSDDLVFLGYLLPVVNTIFASPTRGSEDAFIPVYAERTPQAEEYARRKNLRCDK